MSRASALGEALGQALGRDLGPLRLEPTGGGCINQAALVDLGDRRVFVKWNERPLPGQFAAEAAGLEALRASGSPLVVPAPLAWSDVPGQAFLALEELRPGPRLPDFDEALGRGLAALHRAGSARGYGFEADGYCGATPQPNPWTGDWVAFYREHRLGHQLRLAAARGLSPDDRRRGERLLERLPQLLAGDAACPSLLHGDLWSGNLHVAPDGRPALIDPAAYYGHREAELGMMALFGGFGPRVWAAYQEAWPLASGWEERLPLYTLYHVLNHYHLFGGGYGADALRIVRRYVG